MTPMTSPSTGFRFGYALGALTREFLRATKRPASPDPAQPRRFAQLANMIPTRNDWDELSRIPTLARRGVDLNQWFDANTKPIPKPAKRRPRQRKQAERKALELRMGPLDELIAPVAAI